MKMRIAMCLICACMLAALTFAHNGMEHVMGTVRAISANSVTVETAGQDQKTISVLVLPATKFVKSGADSSFKDLKVGDRVMIEAKGNSSEKLEAVTVTFGKQPPHDPKQ